MRCKRAIAVCVTLAIVGLAGGCSLDAGRSLSDYRLEFEALADVVGVNADVTTGGTDVVDGAVLDAGQTDAGQNDAAQTDTAPTDTAPTDTAHPDTAQPDAGPVDAGPPPKDGCSGPDGAKYIINITNTTTDRNLTIAWNDKDCKPIVLGQVKPGKSVNLSTFVGRWVVIRIEPNDDIVRSFRVTSTSSPKMQVP